VAINHKKLFRLYREERLTVRRRGGRKRAIGTRAPMAVPQGPNGGGSARPEGPLAPGNGDWSALV
jgi:hypothetical protein